MSMQFSENSENFKEIHRRIDELKTQNSNIVPVMNSEPKQEKENGDGGKELWQ